MFIRFVCSCVLKRFHRTLRRREWCRHVRHCTVRKQRDSAIGSSSIGHLTGGAPLFSLWCCMQSIKIIRTFFCTVALFPCCLFFNSEGTWMKVVMFSRSDSSIENSLFGQLGALGVVIYASREVHMMVLRCVAQNVNGRNNQTSVVSQAVRVVSSVKRPCTVEIFAAHV